jgi:cytochrome P450
VGPGGPWGVRRGSRGPDKKRRDPGDDLISALLGPDGQLPLTDEEYEGLVLLLLAAGNETTRSAIAHGLLAFAERPDQWELLRNDPRACSTPPSKK